MGVDQGNHIIMQGAVTPIDAVVSAAHPKKACDPVTTSEKSR